MEILFDIFLKLHFILRTNLPEKWIFVRLHHYKTLSILLNNITYFTTFTAFLFWLVTLFISRLQTTCGIRFRYKKVCFALVTSLIAATYVFWPILLISTHFFASQFYPWATSSVILFLNISSISSLLRFILSNVQPIILKTKDHIKRKLSYLKELELTTHTFAFTSGVSNATSDSKVALSEMPDVLSKVPLTPELRHPEGYVLHPNIKSVEQIETSQTVIIKSDKIARNPYTLSGRPITQLMLATEKSSSQYESSIVQTSLDNIRLRIESEKTTVNSILNFVPLVELSTPLQTLPKIDESSPQVGGFEDLITCKGDGSASHSINTGNSVSYKIKRDIQIGSIKQRDGLRRKRNQTSEPLNKPAKKSKLQSRGYQGVKTNINKKICHQCGKMINQKISALLLQRKTRSGRIYGGSGIFCQCMNLKDNYIN